jgi:hypothetical protein
MWLPIPTDKSSCHPAVPVVGQPKYARGYKPMPWWICAKPVMNTMPWEQLNQAAECNFYTGIFLVTKEMNETCFTEIEKRIY